MGLETIGTALLGGAASAVGGSLLSSFLGGGGGGGGGGFSPPFNDLTVNTGARKLWTHQLGDRKEVFLENLGSPGQEAFGVRFPRLLSDVDVLRGTLTPGFSQVRKARLAAVDRAREAALGNLRDSLARRRVLGSSFGEAALASAEREFGEAAAAAEAQSFLEELDANLKVLAFEQSQIADALNRELAEVNLAGSFGQSMAQMFNNNAQFLAQMNAQEALAAGQGTGNLFGLGVLATQMGKSTPAPAPAPSNPFAGAFSFPATTTAMFGP